MFLHQTFWELLSNLLLLLPAVDLIYLYFIRKDRKEFLRLLSFLMLSDSVSRTAKLVFRVERSYYDPLAFPSSHVSIMIGWTFYRRSLFSLFCLILMTVSRVLSGAHTVLEVLGAYAIVTPVLLGYLKIEDSPYVRRKIMHIFLGTLIGYLLYIMPSYQLWILLFFVVGAITSQLLRKYSIFNVLYSEFEKTEGEDYGPITLPLGILLSYVIFPDSAFVSALYLAWVDGLAAIFGKMFQTKDKSVYGLVGGFVGAIIAFLATKTSPFLIVLNPIVEYYTPKKLEDNLTIPISTSIAMLVL